MNALFDPPPLYNAGLGLCTIYCSAKAPELRIEIGGQTFFINGKDMLQDLGLRNGVWVSAGADAGEIVYILGSMFLKNVLAIFDVGGNAIRFAARESY